MRGGETARCDATINQRRHDTTRQSTNDGATRRDGNGGGSNSDTGNGGGGDGDDGNSEAN